MQSVAGAYALIESLQQRIDEQQQTLEELSLWKEQELTRQHLAGFSRKTIEQAIEQLIVRRFANYGVNHHNLIGKDEKVTPGRKPISVLRTQQEVDMARTWLVCMMRQCSLQSYVTLKRQYPWLSTRRYYEVETFMNQLLSEPGHPNRPEWRGLLTQLRAACVKDGISVHIVDEELRYV